MPALLWACSLWPALSAPELQFHHLLRWELQLSGPLSSTQPWCLDYWWGLGDKQLVIRVSGYLQGCLLSHSLQILNFHCSQDLLLCTWKWPMLAGSMSSLEAPWVGSFTVCKCSHQNKWDIALWQTWLAAVPQWLYGWKDLASSLLLLLRTWLYMWSSADSSEMFWVNFVLV